MGIRTLVGMLVTALAVIGALSTQEEYSLFMPGLLQGALPQGHRARPDPAHLGPHRDAGMIHAHQDRPGLDHGVRDLLHHRPSLL